MRATDLGEAHLDEHAAIAALQAGDMAGLDVLVQLHQLRAVRTAFLVAGDRALAEDVVAEAFVAAYHHIDTFDVRRPFAPWFMRIVVNGALAALRRNKRSMPLSALPEEGENWPDVQPLPDERVHAGEVREATLRAIGALPAEQRAVVVLRFYLDLSEREVAQVMRTPVGTVKWRLHAAKRALRRTMLASNIQDQLTGQWET
jgi:RNA polymerase sigma-70 factor (ECF subfamily)